MYRTSVTYTLAYVASVSVWGRRESWDESKREERGRRGRREKERCPLFHFPSPFRFFLLSLQLSRNNSIENVGYIDPHKSLLAQLWRVCSGNLNSGGSRGRAWGDNPPLFLDQTETPRAEKKHFETGLPLILWSGWPSTPLLIGRSGSATADGGVGSIPFESRLFHWDLFSNHHPHIYLPGLQVAITFAC